MAAFLGRTLAKSGAFLVMACCGFAAQAQVIQIPDQSGWSGFVSLNARMGWLGSNTIAGSRFGRITPRKISNLFDAPSTSDDFSVSPNFDVRYTFGKTRTQLVLGNLLQDALRFDLTQLVGVRQDLNSKGIFTGGLLFSGLAARVYKDPYVDMNRRRSDTQRDSLGMRLGWERIWGSKFSVLFNYRDIDLNDNSGEQLVREGRLQPGQEKELDRNGDDYRIELLYNWDLIPRRLILTPTLEYLRMDRDGNAIAGHRGYLTLSTSYLQRNYTLVGTALLGYFGADERHPFYNNASDSFDYALGLIYINRSILRVNNLSLVAAASYGRSENDNRFLDIKIGSLSIGLFYRFSTITKKADTDY